MKRRGFVLLVAALSLGLAMASSNAKDEKAAGKKKAKLTCPVAGKAITKADAKVVAYKGGEVYVCCGNCKAKLEKDATPFAAKLNHQLVMTKQAKQVKCPLAGRDVNPEKKVEVAGVTVGVCCGNCEAKLAKATGDEQVKLAFSDAAFKKGFAVKKAKKKKE